MMKTKLIVVSGFEPFGGARQNSSSQILPDLHAPEGWSLQRLVLPVTFADSFQPLQQALSLQPDVVLCLGEASDRNVISLERVALNLADCRIPDNAGVQMTDQPIRAGGPAALWSGLPLRELQRDCERAGVAVELSTTAGLYVCNFVFYCVMEAVQNMNCRAGFVHVPAQPTDLREIVRGIQTLLNALGSPPVEDTP